LHIASIFQQRRQPYNQPSQEINMPQINPASTAISLTQIYTAPCIIVGSTVVWLFWVISGEQSAAQPDSLISPMVALFTLTALVWFIMVVVRNIAVIRGLASIRYFSDFKSDVPTDDRLERPVRTFNNLMQVPTLFYIICILMLIEKETDSVQVMLAWTYVLLRWLHAIIYMALNWVPYRFASWASSCITLGVIWFRFVGHGAFS
jgi:hypothetical protein